MTKYRFYNELKSFMAECMLRKIVYVYYKFHEPLNGLFLLLKEKFRILFLSKGLNSLMLY